MKPRALGLLIAAITAGATSATLAAPLDLSNVPLFAATNAPPPNIMFVFDDSGSMDWNVVTRESDGLININSNGCNEPLAYTHPTVEDHYRDLGDNSPAPFLDYDNFLPVPPEESRPGTGFWRARTHHYNRLYYNPAISYLPWAGSDTNGNSYTNADPAAARINPYNPGAGTFNLTVNTTHQTRSGYGCQDPNFAATTSYNPARYWVWTDTDTDGVVDINDQHDLVEITTGTSPVTGPGYANRTDCIADGESGDITAGDGYPTCTGAQEMQNFANWFQYYRRREFTAKYAYKSVVSQAGTVNMGLSTLHNNNSVKRELSLMSFDSNKNSLLDSMSRINANGGTPLRNAVYQTGEYLSCDSNTLFSSCPAASAAEGGACQQNFMIAMTDGYYNGSFDMPGSGDNEDGNCDTDFDCGAYADDYEDTLADVAMEFYENDIHGTLQNVLPIIPGVDEADHQHVTTYTVAFGVNGTLTQMPAPNVNGRNFWPDPQENSAIANPEKIDDLRHAAFNGRGLFLSADSPDELSKALSDAILSIGDRASSAASVALNSSSLNSESHVYQARFDSADWSGQLLSFPISDGSGSNSLCAGLDLGELCSLEWDAGETLKNQHWDTGRRIITFNRDSDSGAPFRWNSLNNSQKTDLRTHPDSTTRSTGSLNVSSGQILLEYARGRDFPNISVLRERSSPLGDLVNSDPFFVGAPKFNYDFGSYASFRSAHANRPGVVYVGANDGMLHAFAESSGQELFAYVPGDRHIWDDLTILGSSGYKGKHRYFVDGSPTVGDAQIGGSWKTVLVGGLRAGGQTFYALDVTSPTAFNSESNAAAKVLWEFSDEDDSGLGFTFSQPNIVKMNNGKWAAVVGNGYNNTESDGHAGNGKASLFIIFLDGPNSSGNWVQGTHYVKIEVTGGSGTPSPNGLSTPAAVDIDNDFDVDYIYAGDLGGNLWRFDVTDSSPGNWGVSFSASPLFVARDGGGQRQPITVRPEVGPHPEGVSKGVLVMFGTGRYIDTSDNSNTDMQTFYGIYDPLTNVTVSGRGELVSQQIIEEVGGSNGVCSEDDPCFRVVTENEVRLDGTHKGWYLDLVNTEGGNSNGHGERSVSNPVIRAGRIVFTTLIPSQSVCEFGGDGWLMELNMFTGGRPPEPVIDSNGDGIVDEDDVVSSSSGDVPPAGVQYGNGILARPTILTVPSPGGGGQGIEIKYPATSSGNVDRYVEAGFADGRLSWRELR